MAYRTRRTSPRNVAYQIRDRQRLIALYLESGMDPSYVAKLQAQLAALEAL